jgi:hypothetical protein
MSRAAKQAWQPMLNKARTRDRGSYRQPNERLPAAQERLLPFEVATGSKAPFLPAYQRLIIRRYSNSIST